MPDVNYFRNVHWLNDSTNESNMKPVHSACITLCVYVCVCYCRVRVFVSEYFVNAMWHYLGQGAVGGSDQIWVYVIA